MITVMRRYLRTPVLWVIVAVFIASLFYIGTSGFQDQPADAVAIVNGESIPTERYQRRYRAYVDAYSRAGRGQLTPDMAERLGLSQQVIEQLVVEEIVVQRAQAEGLATSDSELNAALWATPVFQEGGRFTKRRFDEVLRRAGIRESAYLDEERRHLTLQKVVALVRGGAKITDSEVDHEVKFRKERVRAAWALVELAPIITRTTTDDADLDAYLKEHSGEFRLPERRRVHYVVLSTKHFAQPVSDADVQAYYKEHGQEFETPRQVKAAHVLVRVAETGGSEAENRARDKVADVIRRAKAGEDFAKLAREVSEDPGSKATGGELGWISPSETVPQFEQALGRLPKGGITDEPVRSPFGYHAIKALDIREGGQKPLAEVAPQIRERLLAERSAKAALARADEIRPVLQAANDFTAEAKRMGQEAREAMISRSEGLPGVGRNDAVQEAAFALKAGAVSAPLETPAGPVILKVIEHLPAAVPPLSEIRDKVVEAVKRKKADVAAAEIAGKLVTDAQAGEIVALAKKAGLPSGETGPFARSQPPPDRLPGDAMVAALQTPVGAIAEPVKTPQGYYVVKTLERIPPDPGDAAKDRDQIAREVLEAKRNQVWESWLAASRAKAKIELTGRVPRSG
jgi:peptidyl-prolyl cis-trans isomerase D